MLRAVSKYLGLVLLQIPQGLIREKLRTCKGNYVLSFNALKY